MEEGSERISTPIRSPSEKDSVILSRASASSSPFGFRKVLPQSLSKIYKIDTMYMSNVSLTFCSIFRLHLVLRLAFYGGNPLVRCHQKAMTFSTALKIKMTTIGTPIQRWMVRRFNVFRCFERTYASGSSLVVIHTF